MAILLVADHDNTRLSDLSARALSAAQQMGSDIDVLIAGHGAAGVAEEAAAIEGVRKVLLADAVHLGDRLAEPMAALVVALAGGYDAAVAAATSMGKDVMPRVAALLDVMQVSDIIAVEAPDTFQRPIYAGNAIETVRSKDAFKVITVRASSFPAASRGGTAPIEAVAVPGDPGLSHFVESRLSESERPDLASARTVVSGGRALGSKEKFDELLLPLADKLGAAVGASRAAVDAGYAPNDWQVGQTGKVVAPDLYLACGISGAIQHLAGMKGAKVIVAINTDPDAPIFGVADYGLVADIFDAVPELARML
jgi:electron transfer flavoprotein alpha subunit